jgi:adenylate cyclase
MADVFVSYARPQDQQARQVADALRSAGYDVWRDDELPAHRTYGEVIEERLASAKAVLVLWSADAFKSQWVRAEADIAREAGTLVQVTVDGRLPPLPFNQIQCADLQGWDGKADSSEWRKVEGSIASLVKAGTPASSERSGTDDKQLSICVLPFENMSGDREQEYFSDGISEDIITDLSKVSALTVVARNTSFGFKGKAIGVKDVASTLDVTHVLEGSVRKAGSRVRITAQLIDGVTGNQLWAERYDRDLDDIFAIQDEISKAIVSALEVRLQPKEKKAIEVRETSSSEAYNLYLMARRHWISGNDGDSRRDEIVVRICRQATAIDPNYARAWALMALAQADLKFRHNKNADGQEAADRALSLDPNIAEAHCVKARYLDAAGEHQQAKERIETALRLNPESWETTKEAARLHFRQGRIEEAAAYFEKAASLMETDYNDTIMLVTCYHALDRPADLKRVAQMALRRGEQASAQDPSNGSAVCAAATALAALGQPERARERIDRALLIDPDNLVVRYNLACTLVTYLGDKSGALELLDPYFAQSGPTEIAHAAADPDMNPIRGDPGFQKMLSDAQSRVSQGARVS